MRSARGSIFRISSVLVLGLAFAAPARAAEPNHIDSGGIVLGAAAFGGAADGPAAKGGFAGVLPSLGLHMGGYRAVRDYDMSGVLTAGILPALGLAVPLSGAMFPALDGDTSRRFVNLKLLEFRETHTLGDWNVGPAWLGFTFGVDWGSFVVTNGTNGGPGDREVLGLSAFAFLLGGAVSFERVAEFAPILSVAWQPVIVNDGVNPLVLDHGLAVDLDLTRPLVEGVVSLHTGASWKARGYSRADMAGFLHTLEGKLGVIFHLDPLFGAFGSDD